jgi:hypothetical protein
MFLDLPDASMLPAHGAITPSVKTRAHELLDHHRNRLEQARELVGSGSSTAYDVAQQMLWTRHQRAVDELGPVHGMTAILEILAHLELLRTRGTLSCEKVDGVNHYTVSNDARATT